MQGGESFPELTCDPPNGSVAVRALDQINLVGVWDFCIKYYDVQWYAGVQRLFTCLESNLMEPF